MKVDHKQEAERLRRKAEECRLDAPTFVSPQARELMLRLAEVYDRIAEHHEMGKEGTP